MNNKMHERVSVSIDRATHERLVAFCGNLMSIRAVACLAIVAFLDMDHEAQAAILQPPKANAPKSRR